MQARVVLENPTGKYTNLDYVRGLVLLRVFQPSKVCYVVVKLEGESRTRLQSHDPLRNRSDEFLEVHKLLYKLQRVFPPPEVPFDMRAKTSFAIAPGSYEYPFEFKIPFNSSCLANLESHGPSTPFSMAGFNLEVSKASTQHIRATLPPTMHQNVEAGIRYFVKATVNVPSMFKENPRAISYLSFDPIEPPRSKQDGEAYARRQHQFNDELQTRPKRSLSLISPFSPSPKDSSPSFSLTAPSLARFGIDIRLPNPPILTCGADVPLRVLFKQLSTRSQPLFLQTFQLELIGYTKLRAQSETQEFAGSWLLTSVSSLSHQIGNIHDAQDTETELSQEFIAGHPLPDAICPSFKTCNIERYYDLVVSLGLAYASTKPGQDQFYLLPLRHRVQVYSGICPPNELLVRMANSNSPTTPSSSQTAPSGHLHPTNNPSSLRPPGSAPHPEDLHFDPPPSYEDAIADNMPPVSGPRPPGYNPQPGTTGAQAGLFDQKS